MNQKAKLSIIGAFVMGATFLAMGMVVFFGAGEFFKEKERFILYFDDSLKGLDAGAPVRFMGVKVGKVTRIDLIFDNQNLSFRTPVYIEIDTGRISLKDYGAGIERNLGAMDADAFREELIDRGLRAQLKIDSLLTGMLYVDIGFHPDKPYVFNGKSRDIMEIPTILSDIAEISKAIESIPVGTLVESVISVVESMDRLIVSVEEKNTLGDINEAISEFKGLMIEVRKAVAPVATAIEGAAEETRKLAANSDEGVSKTLDALQRTVASSQSMMERAETTLESLESGFGGESAIAYRLNRMLGDVSEAARAMRMLAEYIERHPESLVFGKGKGQTE